MTPSKTKKALPSSTSTIFPDQPTNHTQWQTAIQRVKLLYLKRQYKQCVARCTQLLSDSKGNVWAQIHPLHTTFLHSYAALSYELIARSTHNLSTAKLPTLNLAKESYHAAAASLPQPEYLATDEEGSSTPFSDTSSTACSSDAELPTSDDNSPNDPTNSDNHNSQSTYPSSRSSTSSTCSLFADVPKPSPLRIHKAVHFAPNSSPLPPSPSPSPPPPPRPRPLSHISITFTPTTNTWLHTRSLNRYNAHLSSFASMLSTHTHTINILINSTSEAQTSRHKEQANTRAISASSGEEEEEGREREERVRIERGRARGWKRERFAPGRYEELCARALAEL